MAMKVTPQPPAEGNTNAGATSTGDTTTKSTPQSRFLANLNNKYKAAISAQQELTETEYQSAEILKAYNKAVKDLTEFVKKNSRGMMLPNGEKFQSTITPQLKEQLTYLKTFGEEVKKTAIIQEKILGSITKLETETKGSARYVKAYKELQSSATEAEGMMSADSPEYVKAIVKTLGNTIKKALQTLESSDAWIPKFTMGKKGAKQVTGPFDYTSSQYELLKQPGKDIALAGQNFRMGASRTNDPYETIKLSEHLSATVDTLNRKTRADAPRKVVNMEKDMYGTYQHPGTGMGGVSGVPVPTSYGNTWKGGQGFGSNRFGGWQAGEGLYGKGGVPMAGGGGKGPPDNYWQPVNASPIPGPTPPPQPSRLPQYAMMAGDALLGPIGGLIAGAVAELYEWPRAFANMVQPLAQPLENAYRAGTTTGQGTENVSRFISGGSATPTVSNYWASMGFRNPTEAYQAYAAYGSEFRPEQAIVEAAQLSQKPHTGFQDAKTWNATLGRMTDMGLTQGPGGMEDTQKMLESAVYKGISKGVSGKQVMENINRVLTMMTTTGIKLDNDQIVQMATSGADSAVMTLRTGQAQTSATQAYQDKIGDILSDPFTLNMLSNESLAEVGTTSPTAAQIEKITGYKDMPEAFKKHLDDIRFKAPGGSWSVFGDYVRANGAPTDWLPKVLEKGLTRNMPGSDKDTVMDTLLRLTPVAARTEMYHSKGWSPMAPGLIEDGKLPMGRITPTNPDEWMSYLSGTHRGITGYKDVYGPTSALSPDDLFGGSSVRKEPIYGDVNNFTPGGSVVNPTKSGAIAAHTRGFMYTPGGAIAGIPMPGTPAGSKAMGVETSRIVEANALNQTIMEADAALGVFGKAVTDVGNTMVDVLQLIQRHLPDWGAPVTGGGISPLPAHPGAGAPP